MLRGFSGAKGEVGKRWEGGFRESEQNRAARLLSRRSAMPTFRHRQDDHMVVVENWVATSSCLWEGVTFVVPLAVVAILVGHLAWELLLPAGARLPRKVCHVFVLAGDVTVVLWLVCRLW